DVAGENVGGNAMSLGALAPEGGITLPNSSVDSEAGTSSTTSDIARTAGKWLIKIGKGGNIVLMALTPTMMGDGTLDISKLRTSGEQKQDLWFHYTDQKGFNAIVNEGFTIRPNSNGVVYLTKFEMTPAKAVDRLFIGGWGDYKNKGNYVIAFSANPGTPIKQVPHHPYEWVHHGKMKLGSEIKQVNYSGQNPF
ncbi:hypothetical protein ACFO4O_15300, partial [Glaciecola siphonariae]